MALSEEIVEALVKEGRSITVAQAGDQVLGPLGMLPGTWKNTKALHGFGFNLMALPFGDDPLNNGYRVLMNQYDEELHFTIVDKGVPNRGFRASGGGLQAADQTIVALDYEQRIVQLAAADFPESGLTSKFDGKAIHKEPGLWLYMTNENTDDINIARLGSVPHGNSFLAVGRAEDEPNNDVNSLSIPNVNGVVVGGGVDPDEVDLEAPYFAPYKHFHEHPFKGSVPIAGFDGFEPVDTTELLRLALTMLPGPIKRFTQLHVDSTLDHAGVNRVNRSGIVNIPFVVRQADATAMNATFLIYEVEDSETGETRHFMQYVQNVILDFIGRPDGHPGRARWPHVSINTMERVSGPDLEGVKSRMLI